METINKIGSETYLIDRKYIDENGHLGSEFYAMLFKRGRLDYQERYGLRDHSLRSELGVKIVAREQKIKFIKEVGVSEIVEVKTQFSKPESRSGLILMLDQEMICGCRVAAKSSMDILFKDDKTGKIVRPPKKFLDTFL